MRVDNNGVLTFDKKEQYDIMRFTYKILKGRRGSSSKKKRIRKKLFRECILQLIHNYIRDNKQD